MTEVLVTTEAIISAELQSNRHHQQTKTQLFAGKIPFLSPNRVKALKENTHTHTNYYVYSFIMPPPPSGALSNDAV